MPDKRTTNTIFDDIRASTSREEAVALAFGAVSVCWSEPPSGEFYPQRAHYIAEVLLDQLEVMDGEKEETDSDTISEVYEKMDEYQRELTSLVNRYSMENLSDTPDYILAWFMHTCMLAWSEAVEMREKWYGRGSSEKEEE